MVVRLSFITLLLLLPISAGAEADVSGIAAHVVISELQTGSQSDAGQEFVELYNPTSSDVAVDGWQLQYKSATGSTWTKKATLTGVVPSHGFFLLSSSGYLSVSDGTFASGLSGSGGHARVTDKSGAVIDTVGWGKSANAAETAPAPAPGSGQSIERVPGWLTEDGGNGVDADDNGKDFILRDKPEPQGSGSHTEVPQGRPDETADQAPDDPGVSPAVYPKLQLTELLPDPISPQTDAADEFIEIYNPGSEPVNAGGYVLKTGANFHASYLLPQRVIEPGAYLAVYSAASRLSLPNSGGAVQLLSPAGDLLDQTAGYGAAKPGEAFAADGDGWSWTLQPTPGDANVVVADALSSPSAKKLTAAKPAKTAAPKPIAKVKAAAKTSKTKPAAQKKSKAPKASPLAAALASADRPSERWLILGLAGLTVAYIIFEFRFDVQNLIYRFRAHRRARRQAG